MFRYARHFDEPKAEISRVSALLLSWSHLHGIYSPCRDIPPSLTGKTLNSLTNICSRKVFPIGRGFDVVAEWRLFYRQ